MFPTLEVSKLRGWLKALAVCAEGCKQGVRSGASCAVWRREAMAGRSVHAERVQERGCAGEQRVCRGEGATDRVWGVGGGEQRTLNM